jgi:hypothetical protein
VLSKLKVRAITHGAKVRFSLSEPATVTLQLRRGKSTVRTVRLAARAGARTVTVRGASIKRGKYTVQLSARDARGNVSALARKSLKVKR